VPGNGIGPWWFPSSCRKILTRLGEVFFIEASWEKHDEGYASGRPKRSVCDLKFFQAMLRDSSKAESPWKIFGCLFLAVSFWISVRLFGWISYKG
jgi:hypothetical protein